MRAVGDFDAGIAEMEVRLRAGDRQHGNYIMHWLDENDIGSKNASWADPAMDDSAWKKVEVTGDFKELGIADQSLIWLRREVTLPDPLPPGNARISLGSVDKMDTVYINGRQVGASSWVENPRNYFTRELKPGKNVIAIRLFRSHGGKSFISPADRMRLTIGDQAFPLASEWKAMVAVDGRPPQKMPLGYENLVSMPGVLYHGMVEPILPLAITGALWYQGESNAERGQQYRKILPALIKGWRQAFGQGEFPFYIVSLPAYQHRRETPGTDSWAEAREAQATDGSNRSPYLPGSNRRHGRCGQRPPDRQKGGRRTPRLLCTGRALQLQNPSFGPDPFFGGEDARGSEAALRSR